MNNPVNFEIAKLLKEKGWKNYTLHYFFEDGELRENVLSDTVGMDYGSEFEVELSEFLENWNDGRVVNKNGNYCFGCSKSKGYFDTYSAPTVADVVMWLCENHGVWICVDWMSRTKPLNSGFISHLRGVNKYVNSDNFIVINNTKLKGYEVFDSPTEAYEAAIEYCVKNLI